MGYHVHNIVKIDLSEFANVDYLIFFFSPYHPNESNADNLFWKFANTIREEAITLWDGREWADEIFTSNLPPFISSHAFWYNPCIVITLGKQNAQRFQDALKNQYQVVDIEQEAGWLPRFKSEDWMMDNLLRKPVPINKDLPQLINPFDLPGTYIITFNSSQSEFVARTLQALAEMIRENTFRSIVELNGTKGLAKELSRIFKTRIAVYKNAVFFNPSEFRSWKDVDKNKPFEIVFDEAESLLDSLKFITEGQTKYLKDYIEAIEQKKDSFEEEISKTVIELNDINKANTAALHQLLEHAPEKGGNSQTQLKIETSVGFDFFGSGIKAILEVNKDISDKINKMMSAEKEVKKSSGLLEKLKEELLKREIKQGRKK